MEPPESEKRTDRLARIMGAEWGPREPTEKHLTMARQAQFASDMPATEFLARTLAALDAANAALEAMTERAEKAEADLHAKESVRATLVEAVKADADQIRELRAERDEARDSIAEALGRAAQAEAALGAKSAELQAFTERVSEACKVWQRSASGIWVGNGESEFSKFILPDPKPVPTLEDVVNAAGYRLPCMVIASHLTDAAKEQGYRIELVKDQA